MEMLSHTWCCPSADFQVYFCWSGKLCIWVLCNRHIESNSHVWWKLQYIKTFYTCMVDAEMFPKMNWKLWISYLLGYSHRNQYLDWSAYIKESVDVWPLHVKKSSKFFFKPCNSTSFQTVVSEMCTLALKCYENEIMTWKPYIYKN